MSLESITSVTQTAYDQAEAAVIAMLRYNAPNLDLRLGTVLRELLVRPAASFYALNTSRTCSSSSCRRCRPSLPIRRLPLRPM